MKVVTDLDKCFNADGYSEKLSEVLKRMVDKLEEINNDLFKDYDIFNDAFLLEGKNPILKKRNDVMNMIIASIREITSYEIKIKRKYWTERKEDLVAYKTFLEETRTDIVNEMTALEKQTKKKKNHLINEPETTGGVNTAEYQRLKRYKNDYDEMIKTAEEEIERADQQLRMLNV